MKKFLLSFLLLSFTPALFAAGSLPGSDRDSHGCIGSAGYTWSAPMKKCIRPWELYTVNMDRPYTENDKIDLILQRKANLIEKSFRKDAEELLADYPTDGKSNYELDITYDVINTGSIIGVKMDVYKFLGGAHGEEVSYTWNYDTKTMKQIPLLKVVNRKNLATIAKNIETHLKSTSADWAIDTEWLRSGLSPQKIANYNTFSLHTDTTGNIKSITFYFADYQVGPHAMGRPSVTVDLATFQVLGE